MQPCGLSCVQAIDAAMRFQDSAAKVVNDTQDLTDALRTSVSGSGGMAGSTSQPLASLSNSQQQNIKAQQEQLYEQHAKFGAGSVAKHDDLSQSNTMILAPRMCHHYPLCPCVCR
jgi:hypothetical protein